MKEASSFILGQTTSVKTLKHKQRKWNTVLFNAHLHNLPAFPHSHQPEESLIPSPEV